MAQRVILHSDMNNFYASVECLYNPAIRDKPVAVCGDPTARHGIVLAKNYHAKKFGIITGEAIWQAKQKCPGLVVVVPDYPKYLKFARQVREIYADYTDQIEPFGLDEAWLDVTASATLLGDGPRIADEIRQRVKEELGLTGSVGVADNKIFAKLGSDMKKPDATTVITRQNFRDTVWRLPVEELLYVGRSTRHRLYQYNIMTIGDLANCDRSLLHANMGKWGETLWTFANGLDTSPVMCLGEESVIKSIGNSTTTPRDLVCDTDAKVTMCVLAESVAARLREHGLKCKTVQIHVRDNELNIFERQARLPRPSQLSSEITALAMGLFRDNYKWERPVRSLGVRGADLVNANGNRQLTFFADDVQEDRRIRLESTVDKIRERFGHFSIQRAVMLTDRPLTGLNPKEDHVIHPLSYF
jgi:DNA polymerase IV